MGSRVTDELSSPASQPHGLNTHVYIASCLGPLGAHDSVAREFSMTAQGAHVIIDFPFWRRASGAGRLVVVVVVINSFLLYGSSARSANVPALLHAPLTAGRAYAIHVRARKMGWWVGCVGERVSRRLP